MNLGKIYMGKEELLVLFLQFFCNFEIISKLELPKNTSLKEIEGCSF